MSKLNKTDSAILQARHFYNDAKITKVINGGGFTVGSDTLIIEVNRMAWGLFEATILKAMKERQDLRERNPDLVEDDVECPECKGVGKFPYVGEEYDKALADWNEGKEPTDQFYCKPGSEIAKFCSPCQGSGIVLKEQGNE